MADLFQNLVKNINTLKYIKRNQEELNTLESKFCSLKSLHTSLTEEDFSPYFASNKHLNNLFSDIIEEDIKFFYIYKNEKSHDISYLYKAQNKSSTDLLIVGSKFHEHFHEFVNYILTKNMTADMDIYFHEKRVTDFLKIEEMILARTKTTNTLKSEISKMKISDPEESDSSKYFFNLLGNLKDKELIMHKIDCSQIIFKDLPIRRKEYPTESPSRIRPCDEEEDHQVQEVSKLWVSRYISLEILSGLIEKKMIEWDKKNKIFVTGKNYKKYKLSTKYIIMAENDSVPNTYFSDQKLIEHLNILTNLI